MATTEERMKILDLVQQAKITPEEGIRLLEALEKGPIAKPVVSPPPPPLPNQPRFLRVRITDVSNGKVRVNVRLPVTVLNAGMKMGARFSPEIGQMEMGQIMDAIQSGATGQIVDIYDDEDGEHIEVLLE